MSVVQRAANTLACAAFGTSIFGYYYYSLTKIPSELNILPLPDSPLQDQIVVEKIVSSPSSSYSLFDTNGQVKRRLIPSHQ